jgi:hypothetical protein
MNTNRTITAALRLLIAGLLSGAATLSQAQVVPNMLYATPTGAARDNYTGAIGCEIEVGSSNVIVSHLGFFNFNTNTGLNISHLVGLFTSSLGGPTLLGEVTVPAGPNPSDAYLDVASGLTNGFLWVALDPPLLLNSNTQYILAGLVISGDGDTWKDLFTPTWNTSFIGSTATTTRHAIYGPGVNTWPPTGFSQNGNNGTYGDVCLANIQVGPARAGVQQTNLALSAGQTVTVNGFASGQVPITYQWYLATGAPVPGQTNATLLIPNAATTNSGTYYLAASNALGGELSSNVVISVTAIPVGISQQPTNTTVFENYTAAFAVTATGTPPIFYQWSRDGVAIPGATASTYSLVAGLTNNGDVYTCLVSNVVNSVPTTSRSSNAVLTVIANLAQPQEFLHGATADTSTNNFTGMVGGVFETGNSSVEVTHLGYYATQFDSTGTNASLTTGHNVALFSGDGTTVIGSVDFAAGTYPVLNGYMWMNLDPPVVLAGNTPYILAAETFSGQDPWGNFYIVPDFNPYFTALGPTSSSTFANIPGSLYGGSLFPTAPLNGDSAGAFYSAPNMAILAPPAPAAYVLPAMGITTNAGFSETLTAVVEGQAPLTLQWYEEPGVLLAGQTNLTLTFTNLAVSNSGSYYVIATNPVTQASAQSADLVVTVNPDVAPYITQDIAPSSPTIVLGSSVTFSATFNGSPTFTYGWQLNGNAVTNSARVSGANGNALTINDVQPGDAGTYQLFATNAEGSGQSSLSTLTVAPLLPFNNGLGFSSQGNTISWPNNTDILQLTQGTGAESNSAFSSGPLYIGAFEASFTYQVVSPFGTLADGVTFCIQNDPRGAAALGEDGGDLGYGPTTSPGIMNSVALEMDIFTDGGSGVVGFGTNGSIGPYGTTTNEIPSLVLTNGDVISNFVTYDGSTLAVTMTDVTEGSTNFGATFSTNASINIPSVVGSNVAFVGFTGADGGSRSIQQIGNFSFVSLPRLSAQAAGPNLVLSWPSAIGDFVLEKSPVLGRSANWQPVAATPALVNGQNQVTVPLAGAASFYELLVTNVPNF